MKLLIIDRNSSRCGECHKDADPDEVSHITELGYKGPKPGCGVMWTHVSSNYMGQGIKESILKMRPDLVWHDRFPGQGD